ncbi:hypothetical protein DFQ01_103223 [Paenibacillus cellulosilyticus]|uniref:Uncharacterized protein n=1 Tax=Paenibacillus cellulosilyticus TaxID=375489 RepID=A0A2V2YYG5_9BACL|nr:hypothetical protein [Paenibacillus cellulosilyticus]PWW06321.1 hypothetical protein DFQ01_103223 [Paenibacillus cellulosilyticus]QKS42934.1 hypothetical protein HUB94_00080 [Paenibacillus cellulosilyticus]QKS43459.1 hypothetical protein HUB94_02755 [Paenibacillus cellulosilyticus]QKS46319.1 hypothetical protein HUB94_19115 [Paenibacillus cellulosilyticus]
MRLKFKLEDGVMITTGEEDAEKLLDMFNRNRLNNETMIHIVCATVETIHVGIEPMGPERFVSEAEYIFSMSKVVWIKVIR